MFRRKSKSINTAGCKFSSFLNGFGSTFDNILNILAVVAGSLLVCVVLGVTLDVILRYFWHKPLYWMTEVVTYALVYITFLATAWLLARKKHIIVDLVINYFKPRQRSILNTITSILGGLVFAIVTCFSASVTVESFQKNVHISTQLGPPEFVLIMVIPLGCLLLTIQLFRMAYFYLKHSSSGY